PIDDLPGPHRVLHTSERSDVLGRVTLQNHKIRLKTSGDSSHLFRFPKPLGGGRGQRNEKLAKAHSPLGHQHVLLPGIIVEIPDIGSEKNRPSRGEPGSQLASRSSDNLLLRRYAVVAAVVLPNFERWYDGHSPRLHHRKDRFVPRAGLGRGVSDDID